ncbi:hypothetical protein PoB_001562300 [Plakobranchus ocellatus]|uniref:Uncharacterized protein n=1 Tax=Plakobranchus ocellatus TaxID=259542 RepID=A0AAV3Z2V4_9GAST|nr:hypothetical protein PoB_001562300 [Plakobranchus ocellatus]
MPSSSGKYTSDIATSVPNSFCKQLQTLPLACQVPLVNTSSDIATRVLSTSGGYSLDNATSVPSTSGKYSSNCASSV